MSKNGGLLVASYWLVTADSRPTKFINGNLKDNDKNVALIFTVYIRLKQRTKKTNWRYTGHSTQGHAVTVSRCCSPLWRHSRALNSVEVTQHGSQDQVGSHLLEAIRLLLTDSKRKISSYDITQFETSKRYILSTELILYRRRGISCMQ